MKQEKIIEKIKKVLELSKNNPSQEEAQSAALKAQKLMAEYHISLKEVEAVEDVDEITEVKVSVGTGNKWKYQLAAVIANNFRCRHFYYGKSTVVFYGHETDAQIAAMTFETLFKVGVKGTNNFYQNERNKFYKENPEYTDYMGWTVKPQFVGNGLKNSYLVGYLEGIRDVLQKQCTALMIVVPQDVKDGYEKRSEGFKTIQHRGLRCNDSSIGDRARECGRQDGRNAIQQRQLAAAV